ncbi:MAG: GNAT family N-acetyltransferase [Saprospiraceae bacterium]
MLRFKCLSFTELQIPELYALLKLRQDVFILEQDCLYPDLDNRDQASYHLLALNAADNLVAYARILPQGLVHQDYVAIGRVVNSDQVRGQGIGQQLMKEAIATCHKLFGRIPIKISAQCYLLKFYESLGFQSVGDSYLEDDIPHIGMIYQWPTTS